MPALWITDDTTTDRRRKITRFSSDIDRTWRILIVIRLLSRHHHLIGRHIRRRAVRMTAVVEKSPESELVEAVIVPIVVVLLRHLVVVVS